MTYQRVELGEICDFLYGESLPEGQRMKGSVPVYGSNGIVGWHNQAITKGQTIVIGRKGSIGEIHFSKQGCWPIDTTYCIEKTKRHCDLHWLYYMLVALDLTKLNKSAAVPGLNRDDAYEKHIPFYPFPEQKRLAHILEKADRLRRLRRYALALSGTYLQSVFLEMFGDPKTNSKKYPTVRLSEYISLTGGYAFKSEDFVNTGIPVIRIGTVNTGVFNAASLVYLPESFSKANSRFLLYPEDLVITLTGTVGKDDYANVCILGNHFHKYFLNQRVAKITTNTDSFTNEFILYVLRCPSVKRTLTNPSRGIRQANISNDDILNLCIPQPPLYLQQKFSQIVQRYERLGGQQKEAERQAEHLFQTLLHKAFQGELTPDEVEMQVPVIEEEMPQASSFVSFPKPVDKDAYQLALQLD